MVDLFLREDDGMLKTLVDSTRWPSGPALAAAIRQRASQHLRTSLDLTRWRFLRRDGNWSIRTC